MSNSMKQSKLLLEGWRKFYLKEAEETKAEGGEVVRIFDFDGTLRFPPEQFPLLKNAFVTKKMTTLINYNKLLNNPICIKLVWRFCFV